MVYKGNWTEWSAIWSEKDVLRIIVYLKNIVSMCIFQVPWFIQGHMPFYGKRIYVIYNKAFDTH